MRMTQDEARRKRMTQGYRLLGPEHYGCCNSGLRPAIWRNFDYCGGGYYVGPEFYIRQAALAWARAHKGRKFVLDGRTVWRFATKAPAWAKFETLCDEVERSTREQADAHSKARADSRSTDPETALKGALALSDY